MESAPTGNIAGRFSVKENLRQIFCAAKFRQIFCAAKFRQIFCAAKFRQIFCAAKFRQIFCAAKFRQIFCAAKFRQIFCAAKFRQIFCAAKFLGRRGRRPLQVFLKAGWERHGAGMADGLQKTRRDVSPAAVFVWGITRRRRRASAAGSGRRNGPWRPRPLRQTAPRHDPGRRASASCNAPRTAGIPSNRRSAVCCRP